MKISLISLQETRTQELTALESEYLQRLKRFAQVEIRSIYKKKFSDLPAEKRMQKEGEALFAAVSSTQKLVIMDEAAPQMTSIAFSKWLENERNSSANLCFALGGVYGFSKEVKEKAKFSLSLSPLTFTAEMARCILTEQLYRAFTLMHGMPYHK